jgi:integrase
MVNFLVSIRSERLYPVILPAVMSGARRGELLGAQWSDTDLDQGLWRVRRSHATIKDAPKARLIRQEPETEKSERTILLAGEVVEALRHHKATHAQEKLLLGEAYVDRGPVFAHPNGTPLLDRVVLAQFQRLLERTHLPKVRLHDLRHTFATLMVELGESPKTVQTLLGACQDRHDAGYL